MILEGEEIEEIITFVVFVDIIVLACAYIKDISSGLYFTVAVFDFIVCAVLFLIFLYKQTWSVGFNDKENINLKDWRGYVNVFSMIPYDFLIVFFCS